MSPEQNTQSTAMEQQSNETETPVTKSDVQDDVKWLEERLDKQDATLTELKQVLLTLKETKQEQPELFSQKTLEVLQKIESNLSQRMNRKAAQSTQTKMDTPSNQQPLQTVTQTNQGKEEQGQMQDRNVVQDKSVLRFRRKAI